MVVTFVSLMMQTHAGTMHCKNQFYQVKLYTFFYAFIEWVQYKFGSGYNILQTEYI